MTKRVFFPVVFCSPTTERPCSGSTRFAEGRKTFCIGLKKENDTFFFYNYTIWGRNGSIDYGSSTFVHRTRMKENFRLFIGGKWISNRNYFLLAKSFSWAKEKTGKAGLFFRPLLVWNSLLHLCNRGFSGSVSRFLSKFFFPSRLRYHWSIISLPPFGCVQNIMHEDATILI